MTSQLPEVWRENNLPCGCITSHREQPYQYDGLPTFMYKRICVEHQAAADAALREIKIKDRERR